jgi:hypothetical protein
MAVPHFSLYVNDAEKLHKELVDVGVEITDILRRSDHIGFQMKDLDGNVIGLVEWL